MDFLAAQDGPITHTINGKPYTFPVWKTKELLPVLSKLKARRLASLKTHLAAEPGLTALQRAHSLYDADSEELNPADAHRYFMGAEGVDECLVGSLIRGGTPREEAEKAVEGLRFGDKTWLAVRVANIYEPAPVPAPSSMDTKGKGLGEVPAPDQPAGIGDRPTNPA